MDRSSERIVDDCGPLSGWRLGLWRSGWGDAGLFAGLKPRSPEGPETLRPSWASVGKGIKRQDCTMPARQLLTRTDRDGASARAENTSHGPRNAKAGGHIGSGQPPRLRHFPIPFTAEERLVTSPPHLRRGLRSARIRAGPQGTQRSGVTEGARQSVHPGPHPQTPASGPTSPRPCHRLAPLVSRLSAASHSPIALRRRGRDRNHGL